MYITAVASMTDEVELDAFFVLSLTCNTELARMDVCG